MLDSKRRILPIVREEAARNGYTYEQLISRDNHAHVVSVRHYAMWRARNETGRSWWAIARYFNRDHTTVLYGYRRVEALPEEMRGVFPPLAARVKRKAPRPGWGKTYHGKPCSKGHDGTRYVSTGRCVECRKIEDRMRDRRKKRFYAEAAE
jgi:hypothetical protein